MVMRGVAASTHGEEMLSLIGEFMKALKDDALFFKDFESIELGDVRRDKVGNSEVMKFELSCKMKD
jgi:hypothetical protein